MFSKFSGVPVQFKKHLVSACSFQGTVLGTEEEAKMNSKHQPEGDKRLLTQSLGCKAERGIVM